MDDAEHSQKIEGSGNVAFNASSIAGSIHVGDVQVLANSQYFEPNLSDFAPDSWIDPPQSAALVELLREHRLLLIAGDIEDKSDCARHLAALLKAKLSTHPDVHIHVREKLRGKDPQQLESAFHESEPTVLLLLDVSPSQIVGYAPKKLRNLLRRHESFAIITTDASRESWGIAPHSLEAQLWNEISWDSYYGIDSLTSYFLQLAGATGCSLWDAEDGDGGELPTLGSVAGIDTTAIVGRLKNPRNIRYFIEWLTQLKGPRTREAVEAQLSLLEESLQAVTWWYRQFNARDQLLALGLALFDGLPDDLLFAGLELLVSNWRDADPQLTQFDYLDLERFSAYFKQSGSLDGSFRIQCTSRGRRRQILRVCWSLQRRRLLATLPALTGLIRGSAAKRATTSLDEERPPLRPDPEAAAGRAVRRSGTDSLQLDQALVESLGLIGLLSIEVVKPYYLELATDPTENVRQLVARALSTWREDHEDDLLALLETWWSLAEREQARDDLDHPQSRPRPVAESASAIQVAVALTCGYAARFDPPNHLHARLHRVLTDLFDSRDPDVRKALVRSTLPTIIAWHFRQLESLLRARVLLDWGLVPGVVHGIVEAVRMRPEESLALLDSWHAHARAERRRTPFEKEGQRERLLALIATVLGSIPNDERELLSPTVICGRLKSLLLEEDHPFVRHYIFFAIERQAVNNYGAVALLLQDLIENVSLGDRPTVTEVFIRTYLHQRQRLPGGDERIEVLGRTYAIWTESARPLTDVEAMLYGWLLDDSRPVAQQLAVDIFDALMDTALEGAERRWRAQPKAPKASVRQRRLPREERSVQEQHHKLSWLGWAAVFLTAPRKRRVRAILAPLLAELIEVRRGLHARLRQLAAKPGERPQWSDVSARSAALLKRWSDLSNDAIRAIARFLDRALRLYRWRWGLVFALLLAVGSTYYGARVLISRHALPATASPAKAPAETRQPGSGKVNTRTGLAGEGTGHG